MHNKGYVYFIGSKTFGWYKIGKSKIPDVRIENIGILLPFKVEVICVWKAENRHLLESTLHDIYKNKRINGEWFEFTKKEAYDVVLSMPEEARVSGSYSTFTNILEDEKKDKKVIGLKVQKLRGDFTLDEREGRKIMSIAHQKMRKTLKNNTGYSLESRYQLACNKPHEDKKVKINIFTSIC